ncbi:hypothetical protein Psch_03451 [Pelotomaculum schinkii]|uniref:TrbC/VIRB2 family protein n=1 Tax=Pelotomaculum schinkii TaxID=78350 RepID=A0A4Y7R7J5_9FIRM|nr:hypothetical protein [Pelotomaculum schinkii]TEB04689.1 hypothetical protein Psch_03451 [Pelotomaculum schinkii]
MFGTNKHARTLLLLCFLVLSLLAIPQIAFADTGIAPIDSLWKLLANGGVFLLFVILLITSIKKMWEHQMMGLVIIILFGVIILLVVNSDFVIQVAKGIATKLGLTWTGAQ